MLAVGASQFGLEVGVIAAASHFLGGYWLLPNLDIRSRLFLRWGVLNIIWLPYQRCIPHRSPLSHAPVLGSVIRLLYLAVCLLPIWLTFLGLSQVQWSGRTGRMRLRFWQESSCQYSIIYFWMVFCCRCQLKLKRHLKEADHE